MGELEGRWISIVEVSQKQAYIFSSNKLKDNVYNSAVIAWVTSSEYFKKMTKNTKGKDDIVLYTEDNLVYNGGGHAVLEFKSKDAAVDFNEALTTKIHKDYPDIELFVKVMEYDNSNDMSYSKNIQKLIAELEKKKSLRAASFRQGSFGIEQHDVNSKNPVRKCEYEKSKPEFETDMEAIEKKLDEKLIPKGYEQVTEFSKLGGSKGRSNFIAVVHIDGNGMGKRVADFYATQKSKDRTEFKRAIREFSKKIDDDFKDAYKVMVAKVVARIKAGKLNALELEGKNLPVRRIITSGDDICFVCEGRIGIECAVEYIKALLDIKKSKDDTGDATKKSEDEKGYAACAGVAIVHQKYPFYKAYDLAEHLCSNAKKYGVSITNVETGALVSSIDWHIEFGELKDTLEDIRNDYADLEGMNLITRPYVVGALNGALDGVDRDKYTTYDDFKHTINMVMADAKEDGYARNRIKGLRSVLKEGNDATNNYIKFHRIDGKKIKQKGLFDAIELMDTFISLSDEEA